MGEYIEGHPILPEPANTKAVQFTFDGEPFVGREGGPVAAALLACGVRELRRSPDLNEARGLYCGIGHCYECRLWLGETLEDSERVRGCQVSLREGDVYRSTREGD
jgi:sarcosine oxidase subunit alpha